MLPRIGIGPGGTAEAAGTSPSFTTVLMFSEFVTAVAAR